MHHVLPMFTISGLVMWLSITLQGKGKESGFPSLSQVVRDKDCELFFYYIPGKGHRQWLAFTNPGRGQGLWLFSSIPGKCSVTLPHYPRQHCFITLTQETPGKGLIGLIISFKNCLSESHSLYIRTRTFISI